MVVQSVLENILACGVEQWSHHLAILAVYARQASQTRASQQIYEECLYRIVGVVCNGNHIVTLLLAQLVKPLIAQPTRSHLHRVARSLHLASSVKALRVAHNAQLLALPLHHLCILIALFSPQAEVTVSHTHIVAQPYKYR